MTARNRKEAKQQAIEQFDLFQYINQRHPTAKLPYKPRSKDWVSCRAVWRGDHSPSFGVKYSKGKHQWKDFTHATWGDAFDFLTKLEGLSNEQAWEVLGYREDNAAPVRWENITPAPAPVEPEPARPKSASTYTRQSLEVAQTQLVSHGLPQTALNRCWDKDVCESIGMGRGGFGYLADKQPNYSPNGEQFIIPVTDWETGELVTAYARMTNPKGAKYLPMDIGVAVMPWVSPYWVDGRNTIVVEGPNKGVSIQHAILWTKALEGYNVVALQSTSSSLPVELLKRAGKVYILPDPGKPKKGVKGESDSQRASRMAGERWLEQAIAAGLSAYKLSPIGDACDIAHLEGQRLEGKGGQYLDGNRVLGEKLQAAMLAATLGITQTQNHLEERKKSIAAAKRIREKGLQVDKFQGPRADGQIGLLNNCLDRVISGHRSVKHLGGGLWEVDAYAGTVQHSAGYSESNYRSAVKCRAELAQTLGAETSSKKILLNIYTVESDFSLKEKNLLDVSARPVAERVEQHSSEPTPHLVAPDFSTKVALSRAKPEIKDNITVRQMYLLATLAAFGVMPSKTLANLLGVPLRTVQSWLARLEAMGLVQKCEGGYCVTTDWKQVLSGYIARAGKWFAALFQRIQAQIFAGFERLNYYRRFVASLRPGGAV